MSPLDPIFTYKMDELQAKAFKLCLVWEKLVRQEFPGERHAGLRKTGDPRKSMLFQCCYKLVRETKGLIPDKEYRLYILAQLHILKLQTDGQVHALIGPQILVSNNAWKRWKVWKKHYDKQLIRHRTVEEINNLEKSSRIAAELERTKEFLTKEGVVTLEKVKESFVDGSMVRWITTGKVSPYYAILSPLISQALAGKTLEEVCMFDLSVYHPSISDSVKEMFRNEFPHEYIGYEINPKTSEVGHEDGRTR
jgi:hypothetical protein